MSSRSTCFSALFFVLIFLLTGCAGHAAQAPEAVTVGEAVYKTAFYGTLFPASLTYEAETLHSSAGSLRKIAHDTFELYHAALGPYGEGTVYCAEKDYETALAFYQDPRHYRYYCTLGAESDTAVPQTVELLGVDTHTLQALFDFAERVQYDPFDETHNAAIETVSFPMPDDTQTPCLCFYKQSVDSLFVSSQAPTYYILNNRLYSVYQYDLGQGDEGTLLAVPVPAAISDELVTFLKSYL